MSPIPDYDENGNLHNGIHKTNTGEIVERYQGENSLIRASRTQNLLEFIEFLRPFAVAIYIDGSYITEKLEPGDVDVAVILPRGFNFQSPEGEKMREYVASKEISHLDIFPFVEVDQSEYLRKRVEGWSTDREDNPKGILYLELNP